MADIAYAREFVRAFSHKITCSLGSLNVDPPQSTYLCLFKPTGLFDFQTLLNPGQHWLGLSTSAVDFWDNNFFGNISTVIDDQWFMGIASKADTQQARMHLYSYTAEAWTHGDGNGNTDSLSTISGTIGFGSNDFGESFDGLIAAAAVWVGDALSDGECETLSDTLASWMALSPDAAWLFNQESTATPVEDLIGTADQTALNGTSAVEISDLPFDIGGDPSPQLLRPVADSVPGEWIGVGA